MRRSPGAYRWLSPRSDAEFCQGSSSASHEHMSSPSVCNTSLANNIGGRTPVVGRFAPIRMLGPGALEPRVPRALSIAVAGSGPFRKVSAFRWLDGEARGISEMVNAEMAL